ncbi:hypothetical protein [Haliscomenobacter sp.]|uniref:hypothetical protein n=1 Tax=Haliscomenobacter sp. TaxID=2717303 RepID=UPI0033652BDD
MSLTIDLPITVELTLRKNAEKQGVTLERYISSLLTEFDGEKSIEPQENLTENELLQRIHLNVNPTDLEEYYRLTEIFKAGNITLKDHEKLINLNDLIEIAHANRMKYLLELAKLRNKSLEDMVYELGIKRKVA